MSTAAVSLCRLKWSLPINVQRSLRLSQSNSRWTNLKCSTWVSSDKSGCNASYTNNAEQVNVFEELGSLRSKRFQSSYCAKVRAGAKKKKNSILPVKYLIILSNAAFQARTLPLLFLEHGCLATHQSNLWRPYQLFRGLIWYKVRLFYRLPIPRINSIWMQLNCWVMSVTMSEFALSM